MLNKVVSLILLASALSTAYPQWVHRSKKLLLFPELAIHYKQPVRAPQRQEITVNQPAQLEFNDAIELSKDQPKRQVRESDMAVPPTSKDKFSIRHPCYFSPVQCLLELPEEQIRVIIKTQEGVANKANTYTHRSIDRSTMRYRPVDDRNNNRLSEKLLHFYDHF